MECMAVGAVGDVGLEVNPIALTIEILSALKIKGEGAVDCPPASPLVGDAPDVGAGLIQTEQIQMPVGLGSIESKVRTFPRTSTL